MTDVKITTNVFFITLSENGVPDRQAVGTFDVCLAWPKFVPLILCVRTQLN